MIKYLYKTYNYIKLLYHIRYIYNNIDINNDLYWIDILKNDIERCGSMAIKCVQWILPRYELSNPKSKVLDNFKDFYDNCNIHELSYTKNIYKKYKNTNLTDDYKIIKLLGSGSIGQVYLVSDIKTNIKYALKINHPDLNIDYSIFKIFFKSILLFINYKKYIPIDDIDSFLQSMKNQIDLNNEYEYNKRFVDIYKNNDCIIIPEIIEHYENMILIKYIDGIKFTKIHSEYERSKILTLLSIFTSNTCLHNLSHGDLHIGNWSIKDGKLIVYDYGFCFNISSIEYKLLDELISLDEKEMIIPKFFNYYLDKEYNQNVDKELIIKSLDTIIKKYREIDSPILKNFLHSVTEFCIEYDILLSSTCINGLIIFLQTSSYYDSVANCSKNSTYTSYLVNILSTCKTYNICPELIDYTNKKIDDNNNNTNIEKDFSKFEGLKKFM